MKWWFDRYKTIDLPEGQINDPLSGNTISCSSSQLTCLRLGPLTLLVRCFWNYKNTRKPSGVLHIVAKIPGHCHEQFMQTLIVCLLKTQLFLLF